MASYGETAAATGRPAALRETDTRPVAGVVVGRANGGYGVGLGARWPFTGRLLPTSGPGWCARLADSRDAETPDVALVLAFVRGFDAALTAIDQVVSELDVTVPDEGLPSPVAPCQGH